MSNFFYARIYEAVAKTSEYLSPMVVTIAEQLVKVFINSFCNAIMLLSKTPTKYVPRCRKFKPRKVLSNVDMDLNENNIGLTDDGPKNSMDRRI